MANLTTFYQQNQFPSPFMRPINYPLPRQAQPQSFTVTGLQRKIKSVNKLTQKEILENTKKSIYKRGKKLETCFCFDDMEDGQEIRVLKCGHKEFHLKCIDKWLKVEGRCPICRTKQREKSVKKVVFEEVEIHYDFSVVPNGGQEGGGGGRQPRSNSRTVNPFNSTTQNITTPSNYQRNNNLYGYNYNNSNRTSGVVQRTQNLISQGVYTMEPNRAVHRIQNAYRPSLTRLTSPSNRVNRVTRVNNNVRENRNRQSSQNRRVNTMNQLRVQSQQRSPSTATNQPNNTTRTNNTANTNNNTNTNNTNNQERARNRSINPIITNYQYQNRSNMPSNILRNRTPYLNIRNRRTTNTQPAQQQQTQQQNNTTNQNPPQRRQLTLQETLAQYRRTNQQRRTQPLQTSLNEYRRTRTRLTSWQQQNKQQQTSAQQRLQQLLDEKRNESQQQQQQQRQEQPVNNAEEIGNGRGVNSIVPRQQVISPTQTPNSTQQTHNFRSQYSLVNNNILSRQNLNQSRRHQDYLNNISTIINRGRRRN